MIAEIATILAIIVAVAYVFGVVIAFFMGADLRTDARIKREVYTHPHRKGYDWATEKLEEATVEHQEGCRRQVRAPLWPIDAARWIKGQILTAIIDSDPERGPETRVIVQKEDDK